MLPGKLRFSTHVAQEVEDKCHSHKCPSYFSFYCQVPCQMAQNSPLASLGRLLSPGETTCFPAGAEQPLRRVWPWYTRPGTAHQTQPPSPLPMLPLQPSRCNPAIADLPAAKPALLNHMACCYFGVTPDWRASNSRKQIFKNF